MIISNPFTLISIADGSFLCAPCGETIYDLKHCCKEQHEEMAREAAKLLNDENS